ncbi:MAG: hypothetical protein C6W54_00800 [Bacillaceae bacterium]|nr:MAG: hypothetical protein C6W54_00800 [Bacillaceae bacterium]
MTIDFILKGKASEENLQNFIFKVLNGQMLDIKKISPFFLPIINRVFLDKILIIVFFNSYAFLNIFS